MRIIRGGADSEAAPMGQRMALSMGSAMDDCIASVYAYNADTYFNELTESTNQCIQEP